MRKQRLLIFCVFGSILLLGIGYALLLWLTPFEGIPCLFYQWTGLLCPGCGLTHAAMALLDGNPLLALSPNPLFPLYVFYAGWIFLSVVWEYVKKKETPFSWGPLWIHLSMLGTVILFWIVRNI